MAETLAGLGISLAAYVGTTAVGGIIEGISGDAFLGNWRQLRENLRKYRPDGNHEIQEAVLRSYLQATLQTCVVYGEEVGISVNKCIIRELLPRFLAKAEVLSHKFTNPNQLPENAEELYRRKYRELPEETKNKAKQKAKIIYEKIFGEGPQPLKLDEPKVESNFVDETAWINKVIDEYTELLIQLSQRNLDFPDIEENEALNELLGEKSLLMQAENSKEAQDVIRESLLTRVESELAAKFGKLPGGFRDFFIEHWFNYFCACFQYQLSQDNALARKFQSKLLADIQADTTNLIRIFEDFSGEFGQRIKGIEENLAWLAEEQREGFDEIKQLFQSAMPLFAAVDGKEARKRLVNELKPEFEQVIEELAKLREHMDVRFDKLEEILQQERDLTPEEREAKRREIYEEYLQAQTDKYVPAEVVGDIYSKDKFFVDRIVESDDLREWMASGEKFLVLKGISGSGKTALMTEILQEIAPDAKLDHEKIEGIMTFYFRDEMQQVNFLDICKKADARLEKAKKNHSFAEQYRTFKKENPAKLPVQIADNLVKELSGLGEVLFVFDNFESALSDRKITDGEIRAFLQIALNGTNNLRFLLTSQVIPDIEVKNYKPKDFEIGDLPENYAKDFLREKGVELRDEAGVDCGLAEASEEDLDNLLRIIVPSPMTLVSFVGYLETFCLTEGKVLKSVLADGLKDFPAYDADDKNKGARYFITQQYLRLSQIEQLILKALSIFDKAIEFPVLKSVLPLSLEVRTILSCLKGNSLAKKVGNHRYELSPLPKEVIRNLPEDKILASRRELHLKAASFYLSIRQPIAECYTQEQFEPYFNAIDHFTEAGFYDAVVSVFYEAMERLIDLGYMREIIKRCRPVVGNLSKPDLEADNFMNLGLALNNLGRLNEAIAEYDKAIEILEKLVAAGRFELSNDLAMVYMNKGNSLNRLGRLNEAIAEHDKAIEIREKLVAAGHAELSNDLAMAYMNKGVALDNLGRVNEAIAEYEKAIEIREKLVAAGRTELSNDLARTYMNKGNAFNSLGRLNEAIAEYDKGIEILEKLVAAGRIELSNDLAGAYMNKGVALRNLGRVNEAIAEYEKAIEIREKLVAAGRAELSNALAMAYMNKGNVLRNLGRLNEAIAEYEKAIEILEKLVAAGRAELSNDLAMAYGNKANTLKNLAEYSESVIFYDKAGSLWMEAIDRGENHLLPAYMKLFPNRIGSLISLKDWQRTANDVSVALNFLHLLENPDVPDHFKSLIMSELSRILNLVSELSPENREEIYKNAGEMGDIIRHYVEAFRQNQPDAGE